MCGTYYVDDTTAKEIRKIVREVKTQLELERRKDVRPSQPAVVLTGKKYDLVAEEMKWGFLQYQKKGLIINARAETALEKKMFRSSVLHRRCIIPARHFYEWDLAKNKITFYRNDSPVIYMAGFYNLFQEENRFVILTTKANDSVKDVHDRMPLILERDELKDWVCDDGFMEFALHKTPPMLTKYQEFEQQTLFL